MYRDTSILEIGIAQYFCIDIGIELTLIRFIALQYRINNILAYCRYKNFGDNFF